MPESSLPNHYLPERPSFECFAIADISTGFLAESDLPILERKDLPFFLAQIGQGEGVIFYIPDMPVADMCAELKAAGLSSIFCQIMTAVAKQHIPYVRFDADGGMIKDLGHVDTEELSP